MAWVLILVLRFYLRDEYCTGFSSCFEIQFGKCRLYKFYYLIGKKRFDLKLKFDLGTEIPFENRYSIWEERFNLWTEIQFGNRDLIWKLEVVQILIFDLEAVV